MATVQSRSPEPYHSGLSDLQLEIPERLLSPSQASRCESSMYRRIDIYNFEYSGVAGAPEFNMYEC